MQMTRALQKHVARRQDQTFSDWFAELRELAGERWADVADQAPTIYAVWGGGATPAAGALHGGAHSTAEDGGRIITSPCRILGRGFSRNEEEQRWKVKNE
jgi:hypothetical protein